MTMSVSRSWITVLTISIIFIPFIEVMPSTSLTGIECMQRVIDKSQDCGNMNLLYYTMEGQVDNHNSGLGSEFNHYLLNALFEASFTNHRMVLVDVARHWEYDCVNGNKSFWACYFDMPCKDSFLHGVHRDGFYLMNFSNPYNRFHRIGGSIGWNPDHYRSSLLDAMSKYNWFTEELTSDICASQFHDLGRVTSVAAQHLYQLNEVTKKRVSTINAEYNLEPYSYIAVQIRLKMFRKELSADTLEFLSEKRKVSDLILRKAEEKGAKAIFIATDDCAYLKDLISKDSLIYRGYQLLSPCTNSVLGGLHDRPGPSHMLGDAAAQEETMRVFADIEMLRHGSYFMGLQESNLVRMVYRLRDFQYHDEYEPLYLSKSIKPIYSNMTNCIS